VIVIDDADVGVKCRSRTQCDQITPRLGVDEQNPLAGLEDAPVATGRRLAQGTGGADDPELAEITRRSPVFSRVRKITSSWRRALISIQAATPTTNQAVW
jgi:hypothetical protein